MGQRSAVSYGSGRCKQTSAWQSSEESIVHYYMTISKRSGAWNPAIWLVPEWFGTWRSRPLMPDSGNFRNKIIFFVSIKCICILALTQVLILHKRCSYYSNLTFYMYICELLLVTVRNLTLDNFSGTIINYVHYWLFRQLLALYIWFWLMYMYSQVYIYIYIYMLKFVANCICFSFIFWCCLDGIVKLNHSNS